MSAFICSDKHIATIAIAYGKLFNRNNSVVQRFADHLKRENIRSVNWRYNQKTQIKPCDLEDAVTTYSGLDLGALVDCLKYQSCERPDYIFAELEALAFAFRAAQNVFPGKATDGLWSI